MSFGIIRIQKYSAGTVTGIQIHDTRQQTKINKETGKKELITHTNNCIDFTKSKLNYELFERNKNRSFRNLANERIKQLNLKRLRKDAIVMAQAVVTSDNDFFKGLSPAEQKNFFKKSFEFIKKQYGEENIISAIVHMDETTPHMHVNFVPVFRDKEKNADILSAKKLFTPVSLKKLHDNFFHGVGKNFKLERGVSGDKVKHIETAELKIKTAKKELEKITAELEETKKTDNYAELKNNYKNFVEDVNLTLDDISQSASNEFVKKFTEHQNKRHKPQEKQKSRGR